MSKLQNKCQINRVTVSGSCRRQATVTRVTSAGVKLRLCGPCDTRYGDIVSGNSSPKSQTCKACSGTGKSSRHWAKCPVCNGKGVTK